LQNKLAVAFWFSPDSTKLLLLTAAGKSADDVQTQRGQLKVGLSADMQWVLYNFPLQELREYETFKPTVRVLAIHSLVATNSLLTTRHLACSLLATRSLTHSRSQLLAIASETHACVAALLHEDLRALLQPIRAGE
jgi:hypothetical protein